ncbi:MAG: hypothetical protein ABFC96_06760 [Thermoguttaceae bacterium]
MNRYRTISVWIIALVSALASANVSRAGFIVADGSHASGTVQDWSNLGSAGFEQQGWRWVFQSSTILPGDTPVSFKTMTFADGSVIHAISIGGVNSVDTGSALSYLVQIDDPSAIGDVTLDTAGSGAGPSVVVKLFSGATPLLSLTSTDGMRDTATLGQQLSEMFIAYSWDVPITSRVYESFLAFAQTPGDPTPGNDETVPEPTGIVLWGVGLVCVGIAAGLRRRRIGASHATCG